MSSTDLESKVRRALNIDSAMGKNRRFGHRGHVEVVVRPARTSAVPAPDEGELRVAREKLEKSEQALAVAQSTIRQLQTSVAHSEMTIEETREQYRRALVRIQALETQLAEQAALTTRTAARVEKKAVPKKFTEPDGNADKPTASVETTGVKARAVPTEQNAAPNDVVILRAMSAKKGHTKFQENQKPVDWWSHHEKKRRRT